MQPLFLDFQVFLKAQLNDKRQVAWNVGQWVCNDAHTLKLMSLPTSLGDVIFVFHNVIIIIKKKVSCATKEMHNPKLYFLIFSKLIEVKLGVSLYQFMITI